MEFFNYNSVIHPFILLYSVATRHIFTVHSLVAVCSLTAYILYTFNLHFVSFHNATVCTSGMRLNCSSFEYCTCNDNKVVSVYLCVFLSIHLLHQNEKAHLIKGTFFLSVGKVWEWNGTGTGLITEWLIYRPNKISQARRGGEYTYTAVQCMQSPQYKGAVHNEQTSCVHI